MNMHPSDQDEPESNEFKIPIHVRVIGFVCWAFAQVIGVFPWVFEKIRFAIGWSVWHVLRILRPDLIFSFIFDGILFVMGVVHRACDWVLAHSLLSSPIVKLAGIGGNAVESIRQLWAFAISKIYQWSEQSVLLRWLLMPIHVLLIAMGASFDFVTRWLWTRNYRQLVFSIPAILLMIPLGICLVIIPLTTDRARFLHYMSAAREAAGNKDFEVARLLYRKVSLLKAGDDRTIWDMAMLHEKEGELNKAYEKLRQLASADQPGDPAAHLWIANAILFDNLKPGVGDPQNLVKAHLDHVLELDPRNDAALSLLSQYYLQSGDALKSVETLKKVNVVDRERRLIHNVQIALASGQAGDYEKAKKLLNESADGYSKLFHERKTVQPHVFLGWASSKEMVGDLPEAIRILTIGLEQHPDDDTLHSAYRSLNIRLMKSSGDQVKRIDIAKGLFALDSNNQETLMAIAELCDAPSTKDAALEMLQPLIDKGSLPVDVLNRVATSSMIREDLQEARGFYLSILDKEPNRYVALNNLAWIYAHSEPVDLDKALLLIDKALKVHSHPSMNDTRGQILIKQERWQEAIQELEFVLNGMPNNRKAHEALALAYTKTGNADLAEKHRRLANQ